MSGHSKWATIKHKKAATDAKRGQLFTKVIKELTVAAREGGGNIESNPRLRLAVAKAKEANMPKDNIDKAIKKGTGELPGVVYEEVTYEGYGPAGVAILVQVLTDNKNRAAAEVRSIFTKRNGNMAGAGSVSWLFKQKGFITVAKAAANEDELMSIVLDNGAEDFVAQDEAYEITTEPREFEPVKKAISERKIACASAEMTMLPQNTVKVADKDAARQILDLISSLEDHDDVQNVYANFDIPDEILNGLDK
ncbi:MAG: YebC/PmpR family DNA-binding transcriptional regulator [Candidatus Omnitrophica bacterium]|nr:YebC/PmpR family DNA-binding transcriptional regulator [Candidatus Omnitrophota bacterium]